jgi:hypothetical protein
MRDRETTLDIPEGRIDTLTDYFIDSCEAAGIELKNPDGTEWSWQKISLVIGIAHGVVQRLRDEAE